MYNFTTKFLKGEIFEEELSIKLHFKYTPVLVSSQVLRSRGAGQIDLSFLNNDKLYLYECKNGGYLSKAQYTRLKESGEFLGKILNKSVFIKLAFAK